MSGFLDKAKDMAGDALEKAEAEVEKLEEKLPDPVKEKVEAVTDKLKDMIPGHGDAPK